MPSAVAAIPAADETISRLPFAGYPKLVHWDGRPSGEPALSSAFHARHSGHLVGWRGGDGVWPAHPDDREAVACYAAGHAALYERKDAAEAVRAYEAALERDPAYLQAWVSLAIAHIADNTPGSLDQAETILDSLADLAPGEWLSRAASSIIRQNRAYLHVHRYRQQPHASHLRRADAEYAIADDLRGETGEERLELLAPWAYVKLEMGDRAAAEALWRRAVRAASAPHLLSEYTAKYAPLRSLPSVT
jgi:tetratricopeptide (TPR) repeat protein